MPRLRPPRRVNNLIRLAAVFLIVPWLAVDAQQQQRPAVQQRQKSPTEGLEADSLHTLEATKVPLSVESPPNQVRRKNTFNAPNNNNKQIKNDASAIATLAPAKSAVALPNTRRSTPTGGLTSPQLARSLDDWEVEDFVLLATVDGKLYARDRKTGQHKWALMLDKPMVETTYHRKNRSSVDEDYDPLSIDDLLWIVEPSLDGNLFVYQSGGPDAGLHNTGLTMKKLVEDMSPYSSANPPVVYNGRKETTMITIDATDGNVIKYFGPASALVNDESCLKEKGFGDTNSEECSKNATLTIGRTEYTVGIHSKDGHLITTLKFSEWGPNNFDHDLQRQYRKTLDDKYIYTVHDGGIIGVDHDRNDPDKMFQRKFHHKFASPVVRVFDVARPWGTEKDDPELMVLPQPMPPTPGEDVVSADVFLNHTEDGSWFAMSGKHYPLAVRGIAPAQCSQQNWQQLHKFDQWEGLSDSQLSKALIGLHSIDSVRSGTLLTLSPPSVDDGQNESIPDDSLVLAEEPTILQKLQAVPQTTIDNLISLLLNPLLYLGIIGVLVYFHRPIFHWLASYTLFTTGNQVLQKFEARSTRDAPTALENVPQVGQGGLPKILENEVVQIPDLDGAADVKVATSVDIANIEGPAAPAKDSPPLPLLVVVDEQDKADDTPTKRKRGKRGGQKHKKGPRRSSQDRSQGSPDSDHKPPPTVEDAVRDAQKLGLQTKLEPDIRTVPTDPSEVSGPTLRLNNLVVNTEKLIGTGSNGTMVFEGTFDGRAVAVKRMLIQFFDIASQETKLLRESDDHPNVIRYFAQEQGAGFLYIALELCPASLADVIDKPHLHRELAQSGERDLPNVLYQVTNGLEHLHQLRIVHRDLKPQNILVAMGKDGRPRLLVSDFGLCKKLEGEQSSFRATTAHAAGTSGWRAPELLLDDDARDGATVVDASTEGHSGPLVNPELMSIRRATRAIDIFSLGLVFFYVLSKGFHPFDCGDRYMREVNIRKGTMDLSKLEILGDYAYEGEDLIRSMLEQLPKMRPSARQVMAHPFFWTAKKRLNFLCDVSDHFEKEMRDPPTHALSALEVQAAVVCKGDFLKPLGKEFVDSLGKQRKYTGSKLLDLLRALRNKKNHYEDMSDSLKKHVGPLPEGYLNFWTRKFPNLLITCWNVVYAVQWEDTDRFKEYFQPALL